MLDHDGKHYLHYDTNGYAQKKYSVVVPVQRLTIILDSPAGEIMLSGTAQ